MFSIFLEKKNTIKIDASNSVTDVENEKLDCIPVDNYDLKVACDNIVVLYPFLMLELGLLYTDIQEAEANNQNDVRITIFTLLEKWRKKNPETSTTRVLLDTCSFVGIDTTEMQKRIREH